MTQSAQSFSLWSFILATLRHRKAISAAVALGVATATAVITGALLIGDSMRGSLRALTFERLGKIHSILAPGSFFPTDAVEVDSSGDRLISSAIILLPGGSAEAKGRSADQVRRLGGLQILATDESFWDLDVAGIRPKELPGEETVVLNATAASELGVKSGDQITLRLPVESAVPSDSPLGKRELRSEGLPRMRVVDVIPDRGLGRFSLSANQVSTPTAFVSRTLVTDVLDRDGQANVFLFDQPLTENQIQLSAEALGWNLKRIRKGEVIDVISLTSDNLLLNQVAVDRITKTLDNRTVTPVMTYLANAIEVIGDPPRPAKAKSVPYSTIAAVDSSDALPLNYELPDTVPESSEQIPIVLNDWAADRLGANVGTSVRVFYYEPEVEAGQEIERSFDAVVSEIVPITRPAKPYRRGRDAVYEEPITPYNDPDLTPEVPGVTDQDSISDWDLPFALTRKIEREDDVYWNEHRLTPKAFMPIERGREVFGSRFGETTGLRISPRAEDDDSLASLRAELMRAVEPIRDELGWTATPILAQQLAASRGTTPFDGLFLSLSCFVIFSAMMLIALLLRLGILQRIDELGTLLAVGFVPRRVMKVTLGETAIIALAGCAMGILGGMLYGQVVLAALKSRWVGAVTVPFLEFHWTWRSLVIGFLAGWIVCMVTAAWTLRFLLRLDPAMLLGGRRAGLLADSSGRWLSGLRSPRGLKVIAVAMFLIAIGLSIFSSKLAGQAAAGGFVGGGMLLLIAMLLGIFAWLKQGASTNHSQPLSSISALAFANGRRSPLRITLAMGLIATAAFLILAMVAFRMSPTESGTGGFDLIVTSAQGISRDLRQPDVQAELFGRDAKLLSGSQIAPFRMLSGDDASCNNLYQAKTPTVLGLPESASDAATMGRFAWAGTAAEDPQSTWQRMQTPAEGTSADPVPVVLDQNTAMWSLQMTGGVGQTREFVFENRSVVFEVVGLLAGSVLQGNLIVGEANFEKLFPDVSGYQYFLVRVGESQSPQSVSDAIESRLVDAGVDARSAQDVLVRLLAVQNTYLRTFQSLGAIGLLLGTIGLAVSQLRSVLERRGELAVMRANGFTRLRLAGLVFRENLVILVLGLGCGALAALAAVIPYARSSHTELPVISPLLILLGIFAFALIAGLMAVWRVVTLPLIESLRADNAAPEL